MSSTTADSSPSATETAPTATSSTESQLNAYNGITLFAFCTALATSLVVFGIQMALFLLLRNKLARIFKPKTYLVPERERTEPPPVSPWSLVSALMKFHDREIIKKCGLDAYFFLRYLQTLLVIFIPIALVVIPVLVPINFVGGYSQNVNVNDTSSPVQGLNALSWANVTPAHYRRYWAHLILALGVIIWVCFVSFTELRVYIKIRQDYLTSAEHRLRASSNTVLVNEIPVKWYTEDALRGLFDVFPGGVRNIWLTRDFTKLLDKISQREQVHSQLESAESDLIRAAKRQQIKRKAAEDKKSRQQRRSKSPSKAEKAQLDQQQDDEAKRQAESSGGLTTGNHEDVPHNLSAAVDDAETDPNGTDMTDAGLAEQQQQAYNIGRIPVVGGGLAKMGLGFKKGVSAVGGGLNEAGQGILGGAKAFQQGLDSELERTGGFDFVQRQDDESLARPATRGSDRPRKVHIMADDDKLRNSSTWDRHSPPGQVHPASSVSQGSARKVPNTEYRHVNTTRKLTNPDDMYVHDRTRWWQFWKAPSGSYMPPVPQGGEASHTSDKEKDEAEKTFWQKIKAVIPFMGDEEPVVDYPSAYAHDYKEEKEVGAEWEKWVKPSDRPHHRLPLFSWTPTWFPGFPLIHKKVDTIYWCRAELARLNVEIEDDQQHPERYPPMSSAFIQFNHQVAAHMACQSVSHHIPKRMSPRMVEIAPNDVIWENMAIKWWDVWARKTVVFLIVTGMVILWAFPVAWTASLSNIDAIVSQPWLSFLARNQTVYNAVKAVAGVLPAIVLAILLALVPLILDFLAGLQGSKTGAQKAEVVQVYYFIFLFVQVFLVVSITGLTLQVVGDAGTDITSTPILLARKLPAAASYFFSYMILQALSTSSGTLLQIGTLIVWFVVARLLDNTARTKSTRNTQLPTVTWGSFFPVYTNFACIALIYSVVAPIISIFAIITFSLLWIANRYNTLYVTRFRTDTGGVLYPRAINQTFTGLYVMELCLIGLFSLVRDGTGRSAAIPQAIIMAVALVFTILYQYLLNSSFGSLLRYLPITIEDEAVLRDEAFQRLQDRRLGLASHDDEAATLNSVGGDSIHGQDMEMQELTTHGGHHTGGTSRLAKLNPVRGLVHAGTWATSRGKHIRDRTLGKAEVNLRTAAEYRRARRQKDLEAQRAIGEALYGGFSDEIEDLTPDERDALVKKAFQHYALRARRPIVWIPRDDIGVSDDEILRTREFSDHIWISNEGTALDSKVRVVYGRNPPDFSEIDLINL